MRARSMAVPVLVATVLAAAARPAMAQDPTRPGMLLGAEYRSISFGTGLGTKKVEEFAVPIGLTMPFGSRFSLDAGTYGFSAQRTDGAGAKTSISGVTDLLIRGTFQLKPDVAVLTVAVNVPTGHKLSGSDLGVAGAVATDLIAFPVSNFGSGLNVTTGLALAAPVGGWALGIAGSYRYSSRYQLDALTIRPGGEVRVRVGADRIVGQGRVSLGLTYSTFANDEIGGFSQSPGSRLIPQASWSVPMGRNSSLALYAWDAYRKGQIAPDSGNRTQNTLSMGAVASLRTGRRNTFRPQVEVRSGSGGIDQPNSNAGWILGLIARYQIVASDRLSLVPGVRFDTGSKKESGGNVSITGLSANLTMRASW